MKPMMQLEKFCKSFFCAASVAAFVVFSSASVDAKTVSRAEAANLAEFSYTVFKKKGGQLSGFTVLDKWPNKPGLNWLEKSGAGMVLFERKSDQQTILAFVGTQKTDPRDIIADLGIGLQEFLPMLGVPKVVIDALIKVSPKFARQVEAARKYVSALPKKKDSKGRPIKLKNMWLTGHSLGGFLAQVISNEFKIPAITVNAPGAAHEYKPKGKNTQLVNLKRQLDLVALVGRHMGTVVDYPNATPASKNFVKALLDNHGSTKFKEDLGKGLKPLAGPAATDARIYDVAGAAIADYVQAHPQKTKAVNLGPLLGFDSGELRATRVCKPKNLSAEDRRVCNRLVRILACRAAFESKGSKPATIQRRCGTLSSQDNSNIERLTNKGVMLSGGLRTLVSHPRAHLLFRKDQRVDVHFTDNILNGLVRTRFHAVGSLKQGVPHKLPFTAAASGDLNEWFREKVVGKIIKGKVGEKIKRDIKKLDIVTITSGTFQGDVESFFFKHKPANLKVTVRVLGYDKRKTKTITGTIPIYALHPNPKVGLGHAAATAKASAGLIGHVVAILIRDATHVVHKEAEKFGTWLDRVFGGGGQSDWVMLQAQRSKKCVAPERNARKPGTRITHANCDPRNPNQQWRFEYKALKAVKLRHRASNLCWDMKMTGIFYSIHNGAPLRLAKCKGDANLAGLNQRFWLRPMDKKQPIVALNPTSAMLHCVDIDPKSGKAHQWLCRIPPAPQQRFRLVPPS